MPVVVLFYKFNLVVKNPTDNSATLNLTVKLHTFIQFYFKNNILPTKTVPGHFLPFNKKEKILIIQ